MDRYLPYAMGKVKEAEPMPLWIIPNKKVSLQDIQDCMRDHYEGTPFSLDSDIGGGIWQMPYRPTPLSFKVDGKEYFNERPTSTQQTGFSYIAQLRGWLPRQIGGILWFGNDDGNMVAYTPVYCSAIRQPECYNTPGADAVTFSDKNAFWVCNWVSNMVYPRYSSMFPSLKAVRDSLEQSYFKEVPAVDLKAQQLLASSEKQAVDYLTDYTCKKGDEMICRWRQLAIYLIVKFNDMAEKKEVNGRFEVTPEGVSKVVRPGYPEATARKIAEQTGDRYIVPDWK
jgi:dipeptidase